MLGQKELGLPPSLPLPPTFLALAVPQEARSSAAPQARDQAQRGSVFFLYNDQVIEIFLCSRFSKRLASLNFFMKLVQRLCRTTVEPSFWYEKWIWPTNPPCPWILYAWILCFIAWLSPDYRVRDHEVQLVFTRTTRPSGTPAVAWLPPTKSQTPK